MSLREKNQTAFHLFNLYPLFPNYILKDFLSHFRIRNIITNARSTATNLLKTTIIPILGFAPQVWITQLLVDLKLLEFMQHQWTKQTDDISHLSRLNLFSA